MSTDLFGGSVAADPPAVPPVIRYRVPASQRILHAAKPVCGHCMMTAEGMQRASSHGRPLPEPWASFGPWSPLRAVYRITQVDGSTLDLCVQHAQEHAERGDRDA